MFVYSFIFILKRKNNSIPCESSLKKKKIKKEKDRLIEINEIANGF